MRAGCKHTHVPACVQCAWMGLLHDGEEWVQARPRELSWLAQAGKGRAGVASDR